MPPDDAVVRRTVDGERPVADVVRVVSELEGNDPMEVDVLYDSVGDLLTRLFDETPTDADVTLGFAIEGWRVTVHRNGTATFEPID